ncbi:unnamed protein product [Camellia sinensis]
MQTLYTYYSSSLGIALINRPDLKTQNPNFESTNMKRVFGVTKDKQPSPSIHDASDRINKRSETVDEKIKKLDAELARYEEQIKKTRPGPAQEAVKA